MALRFCLESYTPLEEALGNLITGNHKMTVDTKRLTAFVHHALGPAAPILIFTRTTRDRLDLFAIEPYSTVIPVLYAVRAGARDVTDRRSW